jgi:hypothetical protein
MHVLPRRSDDKQKILRKASQHNGLAAQSRSTEIANTEDDMAQSTKLTCLSNPSGFEDADRRTTASLYLMLKTMRVVRLVLHPGRNALLPGTAVLQRSAI